jgi:hypothetical protein
MKRSMTDDDPAFNQIKRNAKRALEARKERERAEAEALWVEARKLYTPIPKELIEGSHHVHATVEHIVARLVAQTDRETPAVNVRFFEHNGARMVCNDDYDNDEWIRPLVDWNKRTWSLFEAGTTREAVLRKVCIMLQDDAKRIRQHLLWACEDAHPRLGSRWTNEKGDETKHLFQVWLPMPE